MAQYVLVKSTLSIERESLAFLVHFSSLHPRFTILFESSWTRLDPGRDTVTLDLIRNSRWSNKPGWDFLVLFFSHVKHQNISPDFPHMTIPDIGIVDKTPTGYQPHQCWLPNVGQWSALDTMLHYTTSNMVSHPYHVNNTMTLACIT